MEFDLRKTAGEKIILVAHRGVAGGNIPCNTLASYEIALQQGADMIEIDVTMSGDGTLYIFHPHMEKAHLNQSVDIGTMTDAEISELRFVNQDDVPTQFRLNTLNEVFERFKGRCYINCDKFVNHPREISDCIRAYGVMEQILVKTPPKKDVFDIIEKYAPDAPYLVMIRRDAEEVHRELSSRKLNYVGQELLFSTEESPLCSPEYLAYLRKDNTLSWGNAIIYDYTTVLAAGHSDDAALTGDMDAAWGWLARRGFDFIQTDWPLMLKMYLEKNDLLLR